MTDITHILGGKFTPPKKTVRPLQDQVIDAISGSLLEPPENIEIDGQIHRFSTSGKKGDDAGWYIFYPGSPVAGAFGCWRDGITTPFREDLGRDLSAAENMAITRKIADARKRRELEDKKKHERAAATVEQIWQNAGFADDNHEYLKAKQVSAHGIKITGDGRLIIPMYIGNNLKSLQYISTNGEKKFHAGGEVKSGHYKIGSHDEHIFIAEGYATAATIYEQTGCCCYIAFNAGNMQAVAKYVRDKYGKTASIVIVADNDESGTGQKKGKEAADATQSRLVTPPHIGDANDYWLAGNNLNEMLMPKVNDWLVNADEFSQQPAPIKWLIKGWLQSDALIMVHGPSGGGKTFVVLDWCMTIASNQTRWRNSPVKNGAVVYLAGEGHHGLRSRIAAWKHHHDIHHLNMWVSRAGCDLNTAEGYQKAVEAISQLPEKPKMIVVDTLHRFLNGDENSAQDTKTMLDACNSLMALFDCTVLLVHHTGVSDEAQHRARGSSAWRGALEIEISVIPGKNGDPMQIIQRKAKDAELSEPLWSDLKSVDIPGWFDDDGDPVSSAVVVEDYEPVNTKPESEISNSKKILQRAWFDSGAEDVDGKPYISRAAFINLLEKDGHKKGTVQNYLKPSYENGPISRLINSGIIEPYMHGWWVICHATASAFMVGKNG